MGRGDGTGTFNITDVPGSRGNTFIPIIATRTNATNTKHTVLLGVISGLSFPWVSIFETRFSASMLLEVAGLPALAPYVHLPLCPVNHRKKSILEVLVGGMVKLSTKL